MLLHSKQDNKPVAKPGDAKQPKPAAEDSSRKKGMDKQKKTKKPKDKDNNVKRAKSAYNCFCEDQRPKVVKDNPEAKPKDVMKLLGDLWKDIKEDQKKKYEDLAAKDKERYQKELKDAVGDDEGKKDKKRTAAAQKAGNTKKSRSKKVQDSEEEDEDD